MNRMNSMQEKVFSRLNEELLGDVHGICIGSVISVVCVFGDS